MVSSDVVISPEGSRTQAPLALLTDIYHQRNRGLRRPSPQTARRRSSPVYQQPLRRIESAPAWGPLTTPYIRTPRRSRHDHLRRYNVLTDPSHALSDRVRVYPCDVRQECYYVSVYRLEGLSRVDLRPQEEGRFEGAPHDLHGDPAAAASFRTETHGSAAPFPWQAIADTYGARMVFEEHRQQLWWFGIVLG
ncbi:hypothetical protein FOZ63_012030, partial [Perkinsus olseni]